MTDTGQTNTANKIVIAGRFEVFLDEELGPGGIANVYRGRDLRSRQPVAVKTLRDIYRSDPEARRRFRQEARMMAFASHPGLVTFHELIERANESWIVMELVSGRNLKQLVELNGPQPVDRVVEILDKVAAPLVHLHRHKIVHLDIKPQNIILTGDGSVKVIDFGLAQSFAPRQDTIGGSTFGTAAYLSPEQARGAAVDQRTDVYSLGCVAYELFTGRPPFDAAEGPEQKSQLIDDHINREPDPPSRARPDLPFWVDDVVGRALEKAPDHRYSTVRDFADAAIAGLGGERDRSANRTELLPDKRGQASPRLSFRRRRQPAAAVDEVPGDSDDAVPVEEGPGVARRLWWAGGRIARRNRPMGRTLWRLAMYFAIANLLLGTVLLVRGGPESLVERFLSVVPGTETTVSVDSLNLRSGPGAGYPVIALLEFGQEVSVTGLSETDDQGRWWPVETEIDGTTYTGWVWDGGLQPNAWTGRMSFMQGVVENVQSVRTSIGNGIDWMTGLWPL